jgi:DNA-binding transcriptional LysR family regulator
VLLDEGFASLRLAPEAGRAFDPANATRTFRLYVSDVGQAVFIPRLVAQLREATPGIRIVTPDPPLDAAQQMMKLGQIDLALGLFRGLHADFRRQLLFHETYAALVRSGHPTIGPTLSVAQFFAADHVIYTPSAGSHTQFEAELDALCERHGKTRRVALQLAHSSGLDRIVSSGDLIACVPNSLAQALAGRNGVRAVALPFNIAAADIAEFWHERYQRDEGHQWLRARIHALFHDHRPGAIACK